MDGKLFTIEEANGLLPLVRSITVEAVDRYRAAKDAIRALGWLKTRVRNDEPAVAPAELARQDLLIAEHLEALRALIDELERLGCRLRDYEKGVVDFPAATLDSDGFLVYCWALGEDRVTHWHAENEGFEERRLLGAESPN